MDDDSPWMDDDQPSSVNTAQLQSDSSVSQQEWNKLSQQYSDAGYRDGITAGKESTLQAGFDTGFAQAAPFARQVGNLRAIAASLLALLTTTSGAKHAPPHLVPSLGDADSLAELRAVVTALGKLDEAKVLPVDEEAREHGKTHGDDDVLQDEMADLENALGGLGGRQELVTLEQCQARLHALLAKAGLDGVLKN